jgi:LuxR family maltose regulon positive regulatory protein
VARSRCLRHHHRSAPLPDVRPHRAFDSSPNPTRLPRGELAELSAADLRFTADEAAAVLRAAAGPDLPDIVVATLEERTEGWAAGLQLGGLSLRGRSDTAAFVATFSGSHRYVLDYLTEEVLDRQPEPMRRFLVETSILDRLSGLLCDAVTGRSDSQAMLEAIERANLFLVPLDEVRLWWRYHQLFADLLRARLRQERPDRVPELHRAAAAWHEERGLADEAVRHAVAAGDATWAARLIERHADALILRSEGATLQRWLATLPADVVGSRPRLWLAQTWIALSGGDVDAADGLLDAAERAFADAVDEQFEPSAGRAASMLVNVPATIALGRAAVAELRGDAEGTAAFASRALAEVAEGEWLLDSVIRSWLAVAEWLCGRLAAAERALLSIIARERAAGERALAGRACHHLGQIQRAQGRLNAALDTYRQALEIGAPPGEAALQVDGMAHVGMAEVAYQRGELEVALKHVSEGIALCRQLAYTQPLATGLATLAWIRRAQGDAGGARDAMSEAELVAPGPGVAILLNQVPAQLARLLLAQGEVGAAVRWAQARGLSADDEPSYPREPEYLVLARALIAQEQPKQALRLLERLHILAVSQQRVGSVIEIQALRALALAAIDEDGEAATALTEALVLAEPHRWMRVFVDEGPPMAALLGRVSAAQAGGRQGAAVVSLDYLGAMLRALEDDAERTAPRRPRRANTSVIPGLVEPLSERETEVLHLLVAGKANREIADELYVTLDTVKKHVTHIMGSSGS